MDNWFSWLDNAVGALAKKVLSALGIGWISFTGITEFASQVQQYVMAAWGGLPAEMLAIASIAGLGTAFGIVLGAISYRVTISAFSYLGKIVS